MLAAYIYPEQCQPQASQAEEGSELLPLNDLETSLPQPEMARVHNGAPHGMGIHYLVAVVVGILLQWGTTGSAILIAYK